MDILTAAAVALVSLLLLAAPQSADRAREDEIKVAYLYNFAKFVEWPAAQRSEPQVSLVVLGVDPFGDLLDAVLAGKQVKGKPVVPRRSATLADESPQILFVSRSEARSYPALLERIVSRPILTVGEIGGFADHGGMIEFVTDANRVRFVINDTAVRRAGLRVDSTLLNVAARVIGRAR